MRISPSDGQSRLRAKRASDQMWPGSETACPEMKEGEKERRTVDRGQRRQGNSLEPV